MLVVKFFKILIVVSLLGACSELKEGDAWIISESEIVSIQKNLPACGVFYIFTEVQFKGKGGQTHFVYLPCVEFTKKPLPTLGDKCSAKGLFQTKSGSIQIKGFEEEPVRIAHALLCGDDFYDFSSLVVGSTPE